MKKLIAIGICFYLLACNSDVKINEEKINSAGVKLQKTVQKSADSIASKVGRWKDSLDKNDTTNNH